MSIYQQRQQTKSRAMMAATRALERLGIDQSQPIDIFRIIQEESIWLMFQPLKSLYGFYIKRGETPGIGINSKHPLPLQRFTAAHEFAHHILGHAESFDGDAFIERGFSSSNLKELAADTFAAYFLMPPQLVNNLLKRMGLLRIERSLTSLEIYQLSLDMGASYRATVNHLLALGKITPENAEEFRRVSPKQIKAQLRTQPLENSWATPWTLDQTDNGKELRMRVYDDLKISLPENPTTGYLWTFDEDVVGIATVYANTEVGLFSKQGDSQQSLFGVSKQQEKSYPLVLIDSDFEAQSTSARQQTFGGGGNRYFTVRTLIPGRHVLRLLERRSWEDESEAVNQFVVSLEVSLKLTGEFDKGFPSLQKPVVGTTILQGSKAA